MYKWKLVIEDKEELTDDDIDRIVSSLREGFLEGHLNSEKEE
jgi:hypothetical protein